MKFEELGGGVIRRREKKKVAIFVDGTGLDRATRRINRKVNMSALIRGVTSGFQPVVARYYTLIPFEDDSRQRAFLDAVARAGLSVIVKRLPPKGVNRQVAVDLEMASDIVAFALGHTNFSSSHEYQPHEEIPNRSGSALPTAAPFARLKLSDRHGAGSSSREPEPVIEKPHTAVLDETTTIQQRSVVVVCPSRDLSYPIGLVKELGVDTTTADFGQFNSGDVLKSASKWIDLSDSETIWRD